MDNLHRLKDIYSNDERIALIGQRMSSNEGKPYLLLKNLVGAQEAFVLLGTQSSGIKNHLFIAIDKEEAAYLQNTIDNLHPDKAVSLFPDSFWANSGRILVGS